MKKKLFALSLIVICLAISALSTLAYFTYEDNATNVITAGNIEIAIQEWSVSEGESRPFADVVGVMPGTTVSKVVEIKNTGGQPAWVRVSVDTALALAGGVTGEVDLALVTLDLDLENWTELDGYYYYNAPLNSGEVTKPLFTAVTFSLDMSNLYQNSQLTITVDAQATQTAHNGDTALDAAGWPAGE